MSPKAKNNALISLAILLAIQVVLPALLFLSIIRQKDLQEAFIKQNFKEEKLFETIDLTVSDYKTLQFRNKHEISFRGDLYDVHSVKRNGNKISFLVINDTMEEQLERNLDLASNSNSKDKTNLISAFFANIFLPEVYSYSFFNFQMRIVYLEFSNTAFPENYLTVASPPPDHKRA